VGLHAGELAAALAEGLTGRPGISAVEVAGPGFLNIRVDATSLPAEILSAGRGYGRSPAHDAAVRATLPDTTGALPDTTGALPDTTGELRFAVIHSPGEPDIEHWTRHRADNPAYQVRHAHARAAAALPAGPESAGPESAGPQSAGPTNPENQPTNAERELVHLLGEFPAIVARGQARAVARYLGRLADAYHSFADGRPASPRAAAITQATRVVLANGLDLLGVDAPERM
jgi:arginyl-tRNA synthetase